MSQSTAELPAHQETIAHRFAWAAVLAWSTVATGFKLGLAHLEAQQLLLLGTALSWVVFGLACAWRRQWFIARPMRWRVATLGVINPFLYYWVLFEAYARLPAFVAQPLNYTWAITLALLAIPVLRQPLTLRGLVGILVSYGGVALLLVTAAPGGDAGGLDMLGVALAMLSTLFWASYWLLNTRLTEAPEAVMFWSFSCALPLVTVACWLGPGFPALDGRALLYGAWVGVLEMGLTFLLWQQALRRTRSVARISQLIFLSPFLSLVLIWFVLGERFGLGAIAGLAVIVTGLWINQRDAAS